MVSNNMQFTDKLKSAICNEDIEFLKQHKGFYGIDDRFEDEDGDTLLLYALSDEKSTTYDFILSNGADTTLVNYEGEGVAHAIVYSNVVSRLDKLKKFSADLNIRTLDGVTPLLLSISLGRFELAERLINLGADVNISDNNGVAPLHLAAESSNVELVKTLLEKGANIKKKTANGNLPLALAVNNGTREIVDILYARMYI